MTVPLCNARVLIQHEVKYNQKGDAIGTKFRKVGHAVLQAEHFYIHKDSQGFNVCKVSSGDTWSVKKANNPNYDFITV